MKDGLLAALKEIVANGTIFSSMSCLFVCLFVFGIKGSVRKDDDVGNKIATNFKSATISKNGSLLHQIARFLTWYISLFYLNFDP